MVTTHILKSWSEGIARLRALLVGAALALTLLSTQASASEAYVIDITGGIGAASEDILRTGMRQAIDANASLIILRMDTPGGLDSAMREMVKEILASPIPVVTWVGPGGARAASAGTYLLLASHIAAMHPTSHLGAATPVPIDGSGTTDDKSPSSTPNKPDAMDELDERARQQFSDDPAQQAPDAEETAEPAAERDPSAMGRKIVNDAAAYIRTLADRHGRNADWAERAVRDGATLTASEALDENVADVLAASIPELLQAIDGRVVIMDGGEELTVASDNLVVQVIEPTWRQKVLSVISNPSIALLLVLVGVYGLWFEGWNPGAIIPGVIGAISLLLAAYALQIMPVNYVGLGLLLLGIVLIVAELFVPSFGALGLGGIAAFTVGAIMAFDTGVPGFEISRWGVGSLAATTAALIFATMMFQVRLHRRGAVTGQKGMLKHTAVAIDDFDGEGYVWLESERWHAVSEQPIKAGQELTVTAINGLIVSVTPKPSNADA